MDEKTKHTSGRWEVDAGAPSQLVWAGSRPIADLAITSETPMPFEERKANARLIAAAPSLLEALKVLLFEAERGVREAHGQICVTDPCGRCLARAALSQVEG